MFGNVCVHTNTCMNAVTVGENMPSLAASYFAVFGGSQREAFSFSRGKWGSISPVRLLLWKFS